MQPWNPPPMWKKWINNNPMFKKKFQFLLENYKSPAKIIAKILYQYPFRLIIPDKPYLSIQFKANTGYNMNWKRPESFNEKMQWLKVYDRNEFSTKLADKAEVRKFVEERIGKNYIVPLLGIYDSADEIPFDSLPEKFVLKCTHNSGTVVVCSDKSKLDVIKTKRYLAKKMRENYFYLHREYCYKNIKPRIICEEFLGDRETTPNDYKFFCFHGVPQLIQVDTHRFTNHGRLTLYPNWERAPFDINPLYLSATVPVSKHDTLDEMLTICRKLSEDFRFVRVDLYSVGGKVYFGELTLYHGAGYEPITPNEYNLWLGSLLRLN